MFSLDCWYFFFVFILWNKTEKKEALIRVLSCEFCKIFKNTFFFIEHETWSLQLS